VEKMGTSLAWASDKNGGESLQRRSREPEMLG
jgi:hypothetical protein